MPIDRAKPENAERGIVFTRCIANTTQSHAGGQRRQVVVSGRRVKTIDLHTHAHVMEAKLLMGKKLEEMRPNETLEDVERNRIREMDEQGVDVEALSSNPFWYHAERDLAAQVVKVQNERMAELCARHPDRLVAFAGVALQFPDLAIQQLDEAVKQFGMRGVAVGASVHGEDFSEARFHPFWARAEELGVLIFIHPTFEMAGLNNKRFKGNGWLTNVIGNPLETTIALAHLVFEGTLDRFPGLKILAAHGGGFWPCYAAARADFGQLIPVQEHRNQITPGISLKKKPSEYLKDMYFDSLVFSPEALRFLASRVGADRIVIGSDHPVGWVADPVSHILNTPGFSDEERIAMLGGTAARLLGIKE